MEHTNPFQEPVSEQTEPVPATAPEPTLTATTPQPPAPDASPPPQQPPPDTDSPADPRVASLRAMFPDFDDLVLQSVLDSVGGDQDRAIDTLLGMSDPDYMSDARPAEPVVSQTELDEQLARRLMLEDEQMQQQAWQAQQPPPSRSQSRGRGRGQGQGQDVPPGVYHPAGAQQQQPDTMTEITEQFNKIAESGKKTFGSILSKVKAKMQEFDQPKPGQSQGGTQPTWGSSSSSSSTGQTLGSPPRSYTDPYQQSLHQPPRQQQQQAYYDPNPQEEPSPQLSPSIPPAVQGYDAIPAPTPVRAAQGQPAPVIGDSAQRTASPILLGSALNSSTPPAGGSSTPPSSDTPRPPQTGSGLGAAAPIDAGKLGLLPKRPVSLLRTQSPPIQRQPSEEDSDEGLEYTENPFEEGRK